MTNVSCGQQLMGHSCPKAQQQRSASGTARPAFATNPAMGAPHSKCLAPRATAIMVGCRQSMERLESGSEIEHAEMPTNDGVNRPQFSGSD